jgi:hypothetical protein
LVVANQQKRNQGMNYVNMLTAWGEAKMYEGLNKAAVHYGNELDAIFFISAGIPRPDHPTSEILATFPSWYAPQTHCELYCIYVGFQETEGKVFMQQLAAENGGTFAVRS